MKHLIYFVCKISNFLTEILNKCTAIVALAIRLYLFKIFFWAGMLKLTSWSSTLASFEHQYKIVWLTPYTAALLSTTAEIVLPILILFGLGARLPSLVLLVFNIFQIFFHPLLLKLEYSCLLKDHILWGILTAIITFYGHGALSLDYWLQKRVCKEYKC